MIDKLGTKGTWEARCYDAHGNPKWVDDWGNIVVDEGLNYALDVTLAGGDQTTTWYVGLTSTSPVVASGHTMAAHAGWTEVVDYAETERQTWVAGTVAGKSVDNSALTAKFTGSVDGTQVGGAFLVAVSTKGGTTGTLFSVGAFAKGNKPLDDGDTLEITAKYTNSST